MTEKANPFFTTSPLPYRLPPFDDITDADYLPAFEAGMAQQLREIDAITADPAPADVDNTLVALERSGQLLRRVSLEFFNRAAADTSDARQEIESKVAPLLAAHHDAIVLNEALFARIDAVHAGLDDAGLDPESKRLVWRYHLDFVRDGARLSTGDKARLAELNQELSALSTTFAQNQLAGNNAAAVVVDDESELDGMSPGAVTAAAAAAADRGLDGKYLLTFNNYTVAPVLASLTDPALRERVYRACVSRGNDGGPHDNSATLLRMVRLRAERARLLGYPDHASYAIADQTAGSADAAGDLLRRLAPVAVANAEREAVDRAVELGVDTLRPWDWPLATERLRVRRYDFDSDAMRPYLELERVLRDGVFHAAGRLYGLSFTERTDLPGYHPQVRTFEVFNADGTPLGLFCADYFTRDSKNGGAWMNSLVEQSELFGELPVVVNNLNIPKPPDGEPALLTFTEVTTMFHEFGHALHGLFSRVRHPRFTGTNVPRDFVEYPSQVNEMWSTWPQVLANYAVHHETGEPMPQDMVDKLLESQQFNEGFATTEYLAAAVLDLAWHRLGPDEVPDGDDPRDVVERFERQALADAGLDLPFLAPRYRSTYFGHIFAGGYSAGYYSYIWSEVLDADSVEWFKDNGGLSRDGGDRFRASLLSRGGSADAMTLFTDFTGREPRLEPLLKRRGLDAA